MVKAKNTEEMTFKEKQIRINELENILFNNLSWLNLNTDIRQRIAYLKGIDKAEVQHYLDRARKEKTAEQLITLGNKLLEETK